MRAQHTILVQSEVRKCATPQKSVSVKATDGTDRMKKKTLGYRFRAYPSKTPLLFQNEIPLKIIYQ